MVRPNKYPLASLARLKKERADGAARELAKAVSAREEADRRREEAEMARKQAEARAAHVRREERASLEHGELHAADLMRASAWEARIKAEDEGRARMVEAARATVGTKRRIEADAQAKVALARGEVKAVLRHETRWNEAQGRVRDAAEEEAAAEASHPKLAR
jgi:hypothetical protein